MWFQADMGCHQTETTLPASDICKRKIGKQRFTISEPIRFALYQTVRFYAKSL